MEKGLPAKREITFETELFGSKTFLIYVEPVFSKARETIGINYMGMDVTDQVNVVFISLLFFGFKLYLKCLCSKRGYLPTGDSFKWYMLDSP